jgi:hypothetical protein
MKREKTWFPAVLGNDLEAVILSGALIAAKQRSMRSEGSRGILPLGASFVLYTTFHEILRRAQDDKRKKAALCLLS